jgi:hypothetical protein
MTEAKQSTDENRPIQGPGSNITRPLSVTLLALVVLCITGLNLARLFLAIGRWEFLASLPGASPFYISLTGLIWGAAGIVLFWSLWRGLSWAVHLTRATMLTYAAYYWLDRIFLSEGIAGRTQGEIFLPLNWPFAITITSIVMVVTVWILSRPATKAFFGEQYE